MSDFPQELSSGFLSRHAHPHHRRQPEIEGVAVEDAGERSRHDRADAEMLERLRRLLARRAEAEIAPRDHEISGFDAGGKIGIDGFQAVRRQLLERPLHVAARRQRVGIDAVAEHPGAAPAAARGHAASGETPSRSRGSAMCPATAAAATV